MVVLTRVASRTEIVPQIHSNHNNIINNIYHGSYLNSSEPEESIDTSTTAATTTQHLTNNTTNNLRASAPRTTSVTTTTRGCARVLKVETTGSKSSRLATIIPTPSVRTQPDKHTPAPSSTPASATTTTATTTTTSTRLNQLKPNHLTQQPSTLPATVVSAWLPGSNPRSPAVVPYFNPGLGAPDSGQHNQSNLQATSRGSTTSSNTTIETLPTCSGVNSATSAPYKGVDCLAKRRQLSRWLRQVSNSKDNQNHTSQIISSLLPPPPSTTTANIQRIVTNNHLTLSEEEHTTRTLPPTPIKTPSSSSSSGHSSTFSTPHLHPHRRQSSTVPNSPGYFSYSSNSSINNYDSSSDHLAMATVRPISPQYQHALDSAISLAKELASRNMAESGESSPKTPDSPDKKLFTFKLKHFSKSFSQASANIRDIESSISYEAKQAYKSLVERGPYNSYPSHNPQFHHTIGSHHHHNSHQYANDEFSPSFSSTGKFKHMSTSDIKHKRGGIGW